MPPLDLENIGQLILMVGPEGGFSEAEILGLDAVGATGIRLGQHILRTELAAVALLGAVNQWLMSH